MIEESDRARRLARAIAADITLYHQAEIDEGVRNGTLDETMVEAVDEGRALFQSRVSPALLVQSRFFDAALVAMFRPRITGASWATGFDRLRARFAQYPACVVCRAALGAERIAFHGLVDEQWLLLLGCASCLAVTGIAARPHADVVPEAHLEASAAVVMRLRERLTRARNVGALEAEVESIRTDPGLGRLLGVPEVSGEAEPASGVLRVVADAEALDAPEWETSPWPGPAPRLAASTGGGIRRGHVFRYLGRHPNGWRLGSAAVAVVHADRRLVALETA